MFRSMRRTRQQLSESESMEMLGSASYGILSLPGEDGYPYGVPMNYVYADGRLYFHGSRHGLRRDCIGEGCKASFTVVERWDVDAPRLATNYRSVIVFGRIRPLEDEEENRAAATALGLRFLDDEQAVKAEVEQEIKALCCYVLEIEHLSGKEAKALAEERKQC